MTPSLTLAHSNSVTFLTDVALFAETGIRIAFSQRHGGSSIAPYSSLNLGAYVGDDPDCVKRNRQTFCVAAGLGEEACQRINSAEQVHGIRIAEALSTAHESPETDALITNRENTPLLLCFADCVPLILVAPDVRALSVVHAGWRGALAGIAPEAVARLQDSYGADPVKMYGYIGPYIGLQNFTIANEIAAQFYDKSDTFKHGSYVENEDGSVNLDVGEYVQETLERTGVRACNIVSSHIDTVSHVSDYFSYRKEHRVTGRHGALGCLLSSSRSFS